jgi:hypothetical protein
MQYPYHTLAESGLTVGDRVEFDVGPLTWAGVLGTPTRCNNFTVRTDACRRAGLVTRYQPGCNEIFIGRLRPATF